VQRMTIFPAHPPMPTPTLVAAILQGLSLYGLHLCFEHDLWPSQHPAFFVPVITAMILWPIGIAYLEGKANHRRVTLITGLAVALTFPVATYIGWQVTPWPDIQSEAILAGYIFSMIAIAFMLLLIIERYLIDQPWLYDDLYSTSWNNGLVALMTGALGVAVTIVLSLWSALFSVIGIDFFRTVFTHDLFIALCGCITVALGISTLRQRETIIRPLSKVAGSLAQLLLPVVIIVELLFLLALPVTGLAPLWETGNGTALLMALTGLALLGTVVFFGETPNSTDYSRGMHMLITIGVIVLPILCLLSAYGLSLRVLQYGWTVERCWALAIWIVLTGFASSYALAALRHRSDWSLSLGRINRLGLYGSLALLLVIQSPLLDFRKISLASQIERTQLEGNEWANFDFGYSREMLGRPGWLHSSNLLEEIGEDDPELAELIKNPPRRLPGAAFAQKANLTLYPGDLLVPAPLLPIIRSESLGSVEQHIFPVQLKTDGSTQFLVASRLNESFVSLAIYYVTPGDKWRRRELQSSEPIGTDDEVLSALIKGRYAIDAPEFNALRINGTRYDVR
jgi:hypothetical protein